MASQGGVLSEGSVVAWEGGPRWAVSTAWELSARGSEGLALKKGLTALSKTMCGFLWKGTLSRSFKSIIGHLDLILNQISPMLNFLVAFFPSWFSLFLKYLNLHETSPRFLLV